MTTPAQIQEWAAAGGSLYPGAVWKPLPENATQPAISPRAFILHTQAGSGPATNLQVWTYSARPDVVNEAQFYLQMDGQLMQAISLFVRADSSLKANPWAITVETQDLGGATVDKTPWTEQQLQVLAEIAAFLHLHPQIRLPLQPVPTWDGAGVAPHNKFPQWSATAHSCPGKARTLQVPEVIARAQAIAAWRPPSRPDVVDPPITPPSEEDDDMPKYTILQAPGRVPALTAIDGAGITQIGLDAGDLQAIAAAYGAPVVNVAAATWDDINAKAHADISPNA